MTNPSDATNTRAPWYARPGIILSFLGISVLLTALFVETPVSARGGDPRLTTTSTDPLGAKLFYELVGRLGYTTLRANSATLPANSNTIVAVLNPVTPLNATEVHDLLVHVRGGGALFAALGQGTDLLSDSLQISVDDRGAFVSRDEGSTRQCGTGTIFTPNGLWPTSASLYALKVPDSLKNSMRVFTYVDQFARTRGSTNEIRPSTIGIALGAGRVVIASDPDILRNDALRMCAYGLDIAAIEAVGYLSDFGAANRQTIVFDEFHQRASNRGRLIPLMREYLVGTPSGRALLQLCIAGLVLLLAAIPRVLPPRAERRIERRSPLEHVDALARAYSQVGATRTGVLRLVRGLQRRVGSSKRANSVRNDDEFLARVAESKPALGSDISVIRHALNHTVTSTQFIEVGHAINRVEAALTRT